MLLAPFFAGLTGFLTPLAAFIVSSLVFKLLSFFTVITISMLAFDAVMFEVVSLIGTSDFAWIIRRLGFGEALGVVGSAYALRAAAPIYWGLKSGS